MSVGPGYKRQRFLCDFIYLSYPFLFTPLFLWSLNICSIPTTMSNHFLGLQLSIYFAYNLIYSFATIGNNCPRFIQNYFFPVAVSLHACLWPNNKFSIGVSLHACLGSYNKFSIGISLHACLWSNNKFSQLSPTKLCFYNLVRYIYIIVIRYYRISKEYF